jgi:hypothetical protein
MKYALRCILTINGGCRPVANDGGRLLVRPASQH